MITTLSTKGQTVIPESVRDQAGLKSGDKLDAGYMNGLVVMRKPAGMMGYFGAHSRRFGRARPRFEESGTRHRRDLPAEQRLIQPFQG
jgi:AbrB family looped-hinge helix DNA binding protein